MDKEIQNIQKIILDAEKNIEEAKRMLKKIAPESEINFAPAPRSAAYHSSEGEKIVEGRFDGQSMIDDAGKIYPVPANYASKSKLVEGDRLKLTITGDGSFLFKQVGPIDRRRIIGVIKRDADPRGFIAESEGRTYKILLASVTYFKVEDGDSAVLMVPKTGTSSWAAIENVLRGGGTAGIEGEHIDLEGAPQNFPDKNQNAMEKDIDEIIAETALGQEGVKKVKLGESASDIEW